MARFDRRLFLKGTSMAALTAGVATALPVVPAAVGAIEGDGPAADGAVGGIGEALSMAEPVVARITDAAAGEIEVFFGTNAVTTRDPELVSRLLRATAR
jgi:hypothetical protein